jgi:hypothetical protein
MPPTQDLEPIEVRRSKNSAGLPLLQQITAIVATCTTVCFIGLVIWALADRTLLADTDQAQQVFWAAMMMVGGAIPSFVLSLFGQKANLRVTGKGLALSVGGGYAVAIFAVCFINSNSFTPRRSDTVRIIELVPSSASFKSSDDPDVDNPEVNMYRLDDKDRQGPYKRFALHFPSNADRVTLTVSGYIGAEIYTGRVEVTKTGRPLERKTYRIAKSE